MSSRSGLARVGDQRLTLRLAALCGPSTTTLNVASKRASPGVRRALDKVFALVSAHRGSAVTAADLALDGPAGAVLPARLFEPAGVGTGAGLLVYFHGGGFILGSVDSHANTCRFIAAQAGCRVLSVGYRQPPEARFPAALEDSVAAYRWAVAHAAELGADPRRIAVGGDSAGGNLAAAVALELGDGDATPCFAWLIYPFVDGDLDRYASAQTFAQGPLLSRQAARDMLNHYAPDAHDRRDPRITVLDAPNLEQMPPTYIATAGMDPLRDQGERFAERLRGAGIDAEMRRFHSLPHGFNLLLVDPDARAATAQTCAALARGLARPS
jgi:acetyl esterase